ncbi:MAG: phage tail protein [Eubacteriales bacterium]|nr:phage tail protein [Clostridia bacterium]MDZ4042926.1 phage tail protein [Eubacteriales bacterium]
MTFAEYFYHLLHRVFKRGLPEDGDAHKFAHALGPAFDEAQEGIFLLREQAIVATAAGPALDVLGRDRGLPRWRDESDDMYRLRLLTAYSMHAQVGTEAAMRSAIGRLGYDFEISELRQVDPERWAEFKITLKLTEFTEAQRAALRATVRRLKPAHTKLASLDIEIGESELRILVSFKGYPFPYIPCNTLLCGLIPKVATIGRVLGANINIRTDCEQYAFDYPLAGVHPRPATIGKILAAGLNIADQFNSYRFDYPPCGTLFCGTYP